MRFGRRPTGVVLIGLLSVGALIAPAGAADTRTGTRTCLSTQQAALTTKSSALTEATQQIHHWSWGSASQSGTWKWGGTLSSAFAGQSNGNYVASTNTTFTAITPGCVIKAV